MDESDSIRLKSANEFGNGAHVIVPKAWRDSPVVVVRMPTDQNRTD
jgi:hypothetical protein